MIRSLFFLYKSKKQNLSFFTNFYKFTIKINIFRRDIPIKNEEADSRKDL